MTTTSILWLPHLTHCLQQTAEPSSMSRTHSNYSRLPSPLPNHQKASGFAKIDITNHQFKWTAQFILQLAAFTAVLTALVLGARSTVFPFKTRHFLGLAVDTDLQLALVGLINKIMDLLLTKALQGTAGVIVTLWMTRHHDFEGEAGVRLADLELSEELTKPWTAIFKFNARRRYGGWRAAGGMRLVATLSISVCVILQGLAVNTIGVPKKRWYPEPSDARTVSHPLSDLKNVDWMNFWDFSFGTVGGGDISWDVADGYIASSTNLAFRNFASIMDSYPRGWQEIGRRDDSDDFTALDIQRNGSSARGFAIHKQQAQDILAWMQNSGMPVARYAFGISAELKFTVPGTVVSCQSSSETSSFDVNDASVVVEPPESQELTANFLFHIHSTSSLESSDVTCEVQFRRMLFPISIWIIDGDSATAASVNKWWKQYDIDPEVLPHTPADAQMVTSLANQVDVTMKRLEHLSPSVNTSQWLMSIAREVRRRRPEYASDIEALAPTIAFLTNHLLAIARWDIGFSDTDQVQSENVRWQVYGSGPRLQWEWCVAVVFGILALSLVGCMVLSFYRRIVPGEWLTPAGMLVAANCSTPIVEVQKDSREEQSGIENVRIRVAQVGQTETATLANAKDGRGIDRSRAYWWGSTELQSNVLQHAVAIQGPSTLRGRDL